MAARVTPLHQGMAGGERDEGEIARPPQQLEQGHPPAQLNDCSEAHQDKSESTQEETVTKSKESLIEPVCQASAVEVSNWPKLEREEVSLGAKLRRLQAAGWTTYLTDLPGFGIVLAILCVLWGQVEFSYWY